MAIGKSIVDVLRSITGKKVETIADGLEEALSGGSGGGGGILTVHLKVNEQELGVLDKTWQEIHDATYTICVDEDETTHNKNLIGYVSFVGYVVRDGGYIVTLNMLEGDSYTLIAENVNGYPTEYNENSGGGD